jgi:hypothetical protein
MQDNDAGGKAGPARIRAEASHCAKIGHFYFATTLESGLAGSQAVNMAGQRSSESVRSPSRAGATTSEGCPPSDMRRREIPKNCPALTRGVRLVWYEHCRLRRFLSRHGRGWPRTQDGYAVPPILGMFLLARQASCPFGEIHLCDWSSGIRWGLAGNENGDLSRS